MSARPSMRLRQARPLPPEAVAAIARARRLCWWTVVLLGGVSVMMYQVMGGSQAMKTALVEDLLSLVPPLAFLVASRYEARPADQEFVNGHARAFDINSLISSAALALVGLALVWDSLHTLVAGIRPVIGTTEIGGRLIWQGWLMMAALVVSAVPPLILGPLKMRLARQLALRPLHTDADMNKADWMTALAGVVGVGGIGFGLWWADAGAALFIAGSVLYDGINNLRNTMRDLQDARPRKIGYEDTDPLVGRLKDAVAALPWVRGCEVRLHEEGFRLSGIVFVAPRDGGIDPGRQREVRAAAHSIHWRFDEVIVTATGDATAGPVLPAGPTASSASAGKSRSPRDRSSRSA